MRARVCVCVCLNKCVYAAITQTCPYISITIQVSTCTERDGMGIYREMTDLR